MYGERATPKFSFCEMASRRTPLLDEGADTPLNDPFSPRASSFYFFLPSDAALATRAKPVARRFQVPYALIFWVVFGLLGTHSAALQLSL
jgi:hypothetical protein